MSGDAFDRLRDVCVASGPGAMLESLAATLRDRRRWHAVLDVRLLQARLALGLPPTGDLGPLSAGDRDRFDEASLAACREVGWPLLEEGQVAAAWMYLRAAAEPTAVAERLAALAAATLADTAGGDDEDGRRRLHEIVGVALWEGVDPALGIDVILRTEGTCPAVTAFDQAVSRLPAPRQAAAATRLVVHLHAEVLANATADLDRRGIATDTGGPAEPPLVALLEAAGGLADGSIHCDASHLHAVLRIARVCTDTTTVTRAWELASYACRLPPEVAYPGTPPFTDMATASRFFYGAQLGHDVEEAVGFFSRAAAASDRADPLPAETLSLLLWRIGRPADSLRALLARPANEGRAGESLPPGTLPSPVEIAAAAGDFGPLRAACRDRGDEVTFAATLVAEAHQRMSRRGPQPAQSAHGPVR